MPTEQDSYGQLDEMHKLIEELRAKLSQTEASLADLKRVINEHHTKIWSKSPEGGKS